MDELSGEGLPFHIEVPEPPHTEEEQSGEPDSMGIGVASLIVWLVYFASRM